MIRSILTLLTTAIIGVTFTSAQVCTVPFKEALAPCECWENALRIFCHEATDLKAVFERVSPMIDDNFVFDQLHIGYHPITDIPANIFGTLKAREINIYSESNINSIHPDAFNSTYETTRTFIAASQGLKSTEENHELFKVLNRFTNLEELDIHSNLISYIPDDPFPEPMPNLKKLVINYNKVDYLGARVFAKLPALERTEFAALGLTLDKLSPVAFEGIGPNVKLFLNWNDIYQLPEQPFSTVLNNAAGLWVGGETCYWGFCTPERLDCDESIHWICKDPSFYEGKLDGYYCREGTGADHIWEYCGALNSTMSHK